MSIAIIKLKIRKIGPVQRQRAIKTTEQKIRVAKVRMELEEIKKQLEESQRVYLDIVDRLNTERNSRVRGELALLESAVDSARRTWFERYSQHANQEKLWFSEMNTLSKVQKDLKAVELLQEKLKGEYRAERERLEQKESDELSVLRFGSQKALTREKGEL